jgi:hypothetical protein
MTTHPPQSRLLIALYQISQDNENIDIFSVSERADVSLFAALAGLDELDRSGLVVARRLRLTLAGLAAAVALAPARLQTSLLDRRTAVKSRSSTVLRPSVAA